MTRRSFVAVIVCAAVLSAGCGYSLAGRGTFLPAHIRTIGVPMFSNNTPVFEVERPFTEKVRSEFIGRGRYQILPEETGVDAVLRAEIVSIAISPASFTAERQATRYAIVITTKIEFRDVANDRVIWQNPSLVFREEYDVVTGTVATDPNVFFGQELNAVERLATNFARTVVSAILEAF
jgi:hypothetical protein